MKLSNIRIENFKSLKNVDIALNEKINLLIGKNNSGKSNLIKGILFLRKSILDEYKPNFFINNVYGKDESKLITFILTFSLSDEEKSKFVSQLTLDENRKNDLLKSLGNKLIYQAQFDKEKILKESISLLINSSEVPIAYSVNSSQYWLADGPMIIDHPEGRKFITSLQSGISYRESIITKSQSMRWRRPEEYPLKLIWYFIKEIYYLNANRFSKEVMVFEGHYELNDDASNLPLVLSTIAISNKKCYRRIMDDIKKVLNDIDEINTPPVNRPNDGKQDIQIVIEEKYFPHVGYSWSDVSSGTKELIYEITQLNLSKKGSVLIIEEPEIHLHASAIRCFIEIIKEKANEEDKQIIITSHSPIFMDQLRLENLLYVTREKGASDIFSLTGNNEIDEILRKEGLSLGYVLTTEHPSILLIVEGPDDHKIYEKFLEKASIDIKKEKIIIINPEKEGGYTEAIRFGKFLKKAQTGIPFLILLDSDTGEIKEEKLKMIKEAGFKPNQYYILNKKEIEDYLIDIKAISSVANEDPECVRETIEAVKGHGKERLEKILKKLKLDATGEIKGLIARHLDNLPDEINTLMNSIKKEANINKS